jgi:hypothetical protein
MAAFNQEAAMSAFFAPTPSQLEQIVGETVLAYGIVPSSIAWAVIEVESGGDIWAWNPEPKWRWFWNTRTGRAFRAVTDVEVASEKPPADFPAACAGVDPDAEWWGQQASWGLMQPMGAVARENGFAGKFLNALHDPALNIAIGCKHLAGYARRYLGKYGWPGVLRAYNGGPYAVVHNTNPEYPEKVRKILGGRFPDA